MSVNQVNGFNPNFKGERKESGSFVPGFVIGTGAGLLATKAFPPNFLKSEITTPDQLKGLKADEFKLSGDLTDEQKKAEKTIKDYLAKAGTEEAKTTEAKGSTSTTPTAYEEKVRAQATAERTSKELSNSFVNTTEVPVKKFLGGKTVEQYETDTVKKAKESVDKKTKNLEKLKANLADSEAKTQNLQEILRDQEKIKEELNKPLSEDAIKDITDKKGDLKKAIADYKEAKETYSNRKLSATKDDVQEMKNEIAEKRKNLTSIKNDLKAENFGPEDKELLAELKALKMEVRPEYKKAAVKYADEYKKLSQELIEAKADEEAAIEKAKEAKDEADTARRKKADDATSKKEDYETAKKGAAEKTEIRKAKEAKAKSAKNLIEDMIKTEKPEDRISKMEKRVSEAQKAEEKLNSDIQKAATELESSMHDLGVVESKLKVAKEATDGVVKRGVFKQILSGNLSSIKAPEAGSGAAKEAESVLGKAIESLKGHMPKVAPGWGKALAISAGVGVVLGLITKAMGGKKQEA